MQLPELKEFNDETILNLLKLNKVLYPSEVKVFVVKTKQYLEIREGIKIIENKEDNWYLVLDALINFCKNDLLKQISNAHDNNEQLIKRILVLHQQTIRDINSQWESKEKQFKDSEKREKEFKEEVKFLRETITKNKEEYATILKKLESFERPPIDGKKKYKEKEEFDG